MLNDGAATSTATGDGPTNRQMEEDPGGLTELRLPRRRHLALIIFCRLLLLQYAHSKTVLVKMLQSEGMDIIVEIFLNVVKICAYFFDGGFLSY